MTNTNHQTCPVCGSDVDQDPPYKCPTCGDFIPELNFR